MNPCLEKILKHFRAWFSVWFSQTNHTYLGLFKYVSTMDIEYYKSHTSIRPCSLRICFN